VRYLLDTQCWLWMEAAPERLSEKVRKLILRKDTELFLSAASAWEIAIKYALGKLKLPVPPSEYVPDRMAKNGIDSIPVLSNHALRVAEMPLHHRDPFDRLIIAQALIEKFTIITSDRHFESYTVDVLWT